MSQRGAGQGRPPRRRKLSVLVLNGVTKRFESFTAVDDLSFDVPENGIFGFLGANGAGKTTTLRMALDILRPTTGTIEVLGQALEGVAAATLVSSRRSAASIGR